MRFERKLVSFSKTSRENSAILGAPEINQSARISRLPDSSYACTFFMFSFSLSSLTLNLPPILPSGVTSMHRNCFFYAIERPKDLSSLARLTQIGETPRFCSRPCGTTTKKPGFSVFEPMVKENGTPAGNPREREHLGRAPVINDVSNNASLAKCYMFVPNHIPRYNARRLLT